MLDPTPRQAAIGAANHTSLPDHVRRNYTWNPLKDVFRDMKGKLWFAETDALRHALPADPETYGKVPPEFEHPNVRRRRSQQQHEQNRREWEDRRFGGEAA